MQNSDVTMGVFEDHNAVERVIRALRESGLRNTNLSVVGRAYSLEEKSVGLHARGGPLTLWGERGLFWSTLWQEFAGGAMLSVPFIGSVVILGNLADVIVCAVDASRPFGNFNPLGSTLFSIGMSSSSVAEYERVLMADGLLTCVSGSEEQHATTRHVFSDAGAKCATIHSSTRPPLTLNNPV
jgi:hypothetical protein